MILSHRLEGCLDSAFRGTQTIGCNAEVLYKVRQVGPILASVKRLRGAAREQGKETQKSLT